MESNKNLLDLVSQSQDGYMPNVIVWYDPDKRRMGRLIRKLRRLGKIN